MIIPGDGISRSLRALDLSVLVSPCNPSFNRVCQLAHFRMNGRGNIRILGNVAMKPQSPAFSEGRAEGFGI